MQLDAIRGRLAKCPSFGHQYEASPMQLGCVHCGLNRWTHFYSEDVAALLAEIDGRNDG